MLFRAKPPQPPRVLEAMQLRGAHLGEPLSADAAAQLEAAKRRCLACRARVLCDEALGAADARGLALFCPNIHYIESLRAASLNFR